MEGNLCVDTVMAEKTDQNCKCLPSCNKVEYDFKLQVEDMDFDSFCPGKGYGIIKRGQSFEVKAFLTQKGKED